jgi:hypothetical protein
MHSDTDQPERAHGRNVERPGEGGARAHEAAELLVVVVRSVETGGRGHFERRVLEQEAGGGPLVEGQRIEERP